MNVDLSKSERELLKTLYRLSQENAEAHTSAVAARLGVTPGTVTAGVKRLADRGVVIHRPYRGVELTDDGRALAIAIIRRHRIVERFLADSLGYDWQEADRVALQLEHHVPKEVEERMFDVMGEPTSCPHGFPIPAPESRDLPSSRRLSDLEPGERAIIALPGNMETEAVQFLDTLGMRPGVRVQLREKQPFGGPIVIYVDGADHALGERLAERIHVVPDVKSERTDERSDDQSDDQVVSGFLRKEQ